MLNRISRAVGTSLVSMFLLTALVAPASATDKVKTLDIGAAAPDFSLPGVDGKTYSLKDFAAARILVVIFNCNHCPVAQAYEQRIMQMNSDYKDKGVALVVISPNDPQAERLDEYGYTELTDSFADMKIRARERGFEFPYLYDGDTQTTAHAYGAVATPHVFIFDQERKLRYEGRIDDSDVKEIKSHDARNALDALLAGKPVLVETTHVFGCSTKWASKRADVAKALARWDAEKVEIKGIDAAGVAELAKGDAKKLRLVNVWATWCGPCVSEMPELETINRMYRDRRPFEMVTISMDEPEKMDRALETLNKFHVSGTNYLYTGGDKDKLIDALDKEWQGPLPYTMLIAPGGKVIYRTMGQMDPMELKKAIVGYLGRTY